VRKVGRGKYSEVRKILLRLNNAVQRAVPGLRGHQRRHGREMYHQSIETGEEEEDQT
jgi:hypothetical protein